MVNSRRHLPPVITVDHCRVTAALVPNAPKLLEKERHTSIRRLVA
jgi:hypothetical protein